MAVLACEARTASTALTREQASIALLPHLLTGRLGAALRKFRLINSTLGVTLGPASAKVALKGRIT